MQFALLGDHPDGIDMARALTASGRHGVAVYSGSPIGYVQLQRHGLEPRKIGDVEEVLADPEIDAVIIASSPMARPAQLRRALQSEHHVLCIHPADPSPDIAYEAALIQGDTGRVLLPLLPAALHPGFTRLAMLARNAPGMNPRLLELEIWTTEETLLESNWEGHKPGLPGWEVLRLVGGEIGEIYAQAQGAELAAGEPLLVSGRFVSELLFQATYLPNQAEARWRLSLVTASGRATLLFALGFPGPAQLTYATPEGETLTEEFDAFDPWLALVDRFEQAIAKRAITRFQPGQIAEECLTRPACQLGWQDELRALELDDAARRSAERGRSSTLDFQEATEEASFKGTMTLVGCSLIWLTVVLLIVSVWVPMIGWLVLPLFAAFLIMQALRWVLPAKEDPVEVKSENKEMATAIRKSPGER
jgi:hypothetical protein